MKQFEITEAVINELEKAKKKHPNFPNDRIHQVNIMLEEAGEVSKAINEFAWNEGSINDVAEELIQTAAMCYRILETIQSYKPIRNGSETKG
jgi:hypothetical protein